MMNPNAIREVLGIIGNVISFGLFLSPVPTFYRIIKNKSVEQFRPDPYLATILNCAFWVLYGLPFVHPNNILVATINGVGLALELIYVAIYFFNAEWSRKKRIIKILIGEALLFLAVLLITLYVFHGPATRKKFMGPVCVVFNIAMYFSPLTVMHRVIKTKSVKYMPFWLSLTNFLNGAVWTAYACIKTFDVWMVVPNGLGTLSGIIQLVLYANYYKTTNWDEDEPNTKTSQVELPESNV